MPDQELLDDFLEALEQAGSPVKNPVLRQALGWEESQYDAVRAELVSRRIVVRGRGRRSQHQPGEIHGILDLGCDRLDSRCQVAVKGKESIPALQRKNPPWRLKPPAR